MTDKEQITNNFAKDINVPSKEAVMINGVDVSECLFYQSNFEEDYDVKIKHFCSNWHNSCESVNNSNCYFKQLVRKTQECEELKSQVDEDYNYYTTELKTLRDIISNKEKRNAALSLTSGRYRKALEEIEEYQKRNCEVCYRANTNKCNEGCQVFTILYIINKAKGE